MSEIIANVLFPFKTNSAGKVEYLYHSGVVLVKHVVSQEKALSMCAGHSITVSDKHKGFPCQVREHYFFPPLICEDGTEWPPVTEPPVEDAPPAEEPPVEPAPVVEPEALKPLKPKTTTKTKTAKPKTTTRKKVQK